jgi:glycosyltransferase involved in cell wall biosynthesis
MSAGCAIVGSATPPVLEVMTHEENGLLVDFFSSQEVLAAIERVLDHPDRMADMRARARQFVVEHYDLHRICLPAHLDLINRVATAKTMKDLDLLA